MVTDNLKNISSMYLQELTSLKRPHEHHWFGRPIVQLADDIVTLQELIWDIRPTRIIETGIAHGGSLVFYASLLLSIKNIRQIELGHDVVNLKKLAKSVIGIDIELRDQNRTSIKNHPLNFMIECIDGSSTNPKIFNKIKDMINPDDKVLVCLDSNHTHEHVLAELNLYSSLVTFGSYCIVFDTSIDNLPEHLFKERPWGSHNNPKTAVLEFIKSNNEFKIDRNISNKFPITNCPDGFLKRLNTPTTFEEEL